MAHALIVRISTDQIGDLGELLAAIALSRPVLGRYKRPLFRATHLGGKYPAADFLVDVLGPDNQCRGFFFIQVKSTRKRSGASRRRLPITADRAKFEQFARLPAPTYLIGVDLTTEICYIVAALKPGGVVSSITTKVSLSEEHFRIQLYREVRAHWARWKGPRHTEFSNV